MGTGGFGSRGRSGRVGGIGRSVEEFECVISVIGVGVDGWNWQLSLTVSHCDGTYQSIKVISDHL